MKAAAYGTVAGVLFGLSASSCSRCRSEPDAWRRVLGLFCGGTLCAEAQAVLRRAGELVGSNVPVPGVLALDERFSRPGWHVLLALVGLGLALVGAVVISLARDARKEDASAVGAPGQSVATA